MQNVTVGQLLALARQQLTTATSTSALLDAELLLSHVLQQPREHILAHGEAEVTGEQERAFMDLIRQRADHVPLAYLTREKYFYGRPFYVDERVLVPRPETELLVEQVTSEKSQVTNNTTIIDVGTGSGCIIVTLAKELDNQNVEFFATDVSRDALEVAKQNAVAHCVADKIEFRQGNLLEPVFLKITKLKLKNLIITANLPYVETAHVDSEPSIKHEPRLALDSGPDGLDHYRELAEQCKALILSAVNYQLSAIVLCEIGETQAAVMRDIFSFAKQVKIKTDLAGWDRLVVIKL